jgi:hypothetical protein
LSRVRFAARSKTASHCSLRIILVRRGYADERQDAVAQYLAHPIFVTSPMSSAHSSGSMVSAKAGRANDIGEQRRHWPAFTGRSS